MSHLLSEGNLHYNIWLCWPLFLLKIVIYFSPFSGQLTCGNCIFPFTFDGVTHIGCTTIPEDPKPWCSTLVDADGVHVGGGGHWEYCESECPLSGWNKICSADFHAFYRKVLIVCVGGLKEYQMYQYFVNNQFLQKLVPTALFYFTWNSFGTLCLPSLQCVNSMMALCNLFSNKSSIFNDHVVCVPCIYFKSITLPSVKCRD